MNTISRSWSSRSRLRITPTFLRSSRTNSCKPSTLLVNVLCLSGPPPFTPEVRCVWWAFCPASGVLEKQKSQRLTFRFESPCPGYVSSWMLLTFLEFFSRYYLPISAAAESFLLCVCGRASGLDPRFPHTYRASGFVYRDSKLITASHIRGDAGGVSAFRNLRRYYCRLSYTSTQGTHATTTGLKP